MAGSACFSRRKDADAFSHADVHREARLPEVGAALADAQGANHRLTDIPRISQRIQFGTRFDNGSHNQINLPLEDASLVVLEAVREKAEPRLQRACREEPRTQKRNQGHLAAPPFGLTCL